MFDSSQYELLDFGAGRKLERFGSHVLDRPSPAAESATPKQPRLWQQADARYDRVERNKGTWFSLQSLSAGWEVAYGSLRLSLRPTEFGHVGLFPEQAENLDWLADEIGRRAPERPSVLNLFAYTGASTLVAAAAGARVTHVDAAQGTVNWARENAALSGLADAPIRWIAEDALRFARRELKRGHRYQGVILDPPSYGHGPHGESWKLTEQLPELLELCAKLTEGPAWFTLLSCHAPGVGPAELTDLLAGVYGSGPGGNITAGELCLEAAGRRLNCGATVRYSNLALGARA